MDQSVECRHQNATGGGSGGCESSETSSSKCHASADGEAGEAEHAHGFGDCHELCGHRTENRACESESEKSSIESSQPGNELLKIHRPHKTDGGSKDRDASSECHHACGLTSHVVGHEIHGRNHTRQSQTETAETLGQTIQIHSAKDLDRNGQGHGSRGE